MKYKYISYIYMKITYKNIYIYKQVLPSTHIVKNFAPSSLACSTQDLLK